MKSVFILLMLTLAFNSYSQTSCNTSYAITQSNVCSFDTLNNPSQNAELWLTFTPFFKHARFNLSKINNFTINKLELYEGACNSLNLVLTDTISNSNSSGEFNWDFYSLDTTSTYFIKIEFDTVSVSESVLSFCLQKIERADERGGFCLPYVCGSNLIVNGDFELGAASGGTFFSDYFFIPSLLPPGTAVGGDVAVDDGGNMNNPGWSEVPNSGNYFLVVNEAGANSTIWEQQVPVCEGYLYQFCFYVNNIVADTLDLADGGFEVLIDGINVTGPIVVPESPDFWINFEITYLATSTSTIPITITDLFVMQGSGNDIGFDDLSFGIIDRPIPQISATTDTVKCNDSSVISVTGYSPGSTFSWNTGETTSSITVMPDSLTQYSVIVNSGCCTDTLYYSVFGYPDSFMDFSVPISSCCPLPIIATTDFLSYNWDIQPPILFSGQGSNQIFLTLDPNETYEICLTVIDSLGCKISLCKTINECCVPNETIPAGAQEYGKCDTSTLFVSQLPLLISNNAYIVFYRDLIIDVANVNFDYCQIRMAPGTRIFVNPACSLLFNGTEIKALCPEMWEGVQVIYPNSRVTFTKQSQIWDAINAVYSANGGDYKISDTTRMVNNHISLFVENNTGTHTGVIQTSKVYTTSANLYAPHLGERMYQGVYIANAGYVKIGKKVNFDNMDYGVYSLGSDVDVLGNTFDNIGRPSIIPACPLCTDPIGIAIFSQVKFPNPPRLLNVGSSNNSDLNKFNNCYIGVKTFGRVNQVTINNKFDYMEEAAIMAQSGNNRNIDIRENNMNYVKLGVHLVDMPVSTVNIHKNKIKNTVVSCFFLCVDNTGIMIENTTLSNMTMNITDNDIERKRTGIWLRMVAGPNVNINKVTIGNKISFPQLSSNGTGPVTFYGIRLENCDNINVDENSITKTGIDPTLAVFKKILGISCENTTNSFITENSTLKMGAGLWITGACQGTIFSCNSLQRAWNSLYFSSANITDQLILSGNNVSQSNRYLSNLSGLKLEGNLLTGGVNWFYNTSGVNSSGIYNPNVSNVIGLTINPFGDQVTNPCAIFFSPPGGGGGGGGSREALLPIVSNQRTFLSMQSENEFWDKDFGYNSLLSNPSWMTSGNPDDSIYQDFYNSLYPSCINKYCGVREAIENENYILADSLNDLILGACTIEVHRKTATEIVLKFIQGDTLTLSDSVYLDQMAFSDPFIYGESVMSARVILQLDPSVSDLRNAIIDEPIVVNLNKPNIKLYPNPATNNVTIEINGAEIIENYYFEINDITGRGILNRNITKNKFEVDITDYSEGIYFISVFDPDGLIDRKKLVVVK